MSSTLNIYGARLETPSPQSFVFIAPPNDTPLPDDTIIFLVAKLHLWPNDITLLDAIQLFPVPGDPSSEFYQDNIPDMPYPNIYAIGVVQGKHEVLANGKSRGFTLNVSDCVVDGSPRWINVPPPSPNSFIYVLGSCVSIRGDGALSISLLQLLFNLSPPQSAPGPPETPTKRRKFNAFSSPSGPSTSSIQGNAAAPLPLPSQSVQSAAISEAGPSSTLATFSERSLSPLSPIPVDPFVAAPSVPSSTGHVSDSSPSVPRPSANTRGKRAAGKP
ncbi:hypothetical protein C8Q78DRAFT_1081033 [Trametes maxima]|nr:hypothetical protein C8Q78DRAFT_1081033 [Trametes maxima]